MTTNRSSGNLLSLQQSFDNKTKPKQLNTFYNAICGSGDRKQRTLSNNLSSLPSQQTLSPRTCRELMFNQSKSPTGQTKISAEKAKTEMFGYLERVPGDLAVDSDQLAWAH